MRHSHLQYSLFTTCVNVQDKKQGHRPSSSQTKLVFYPVANQDHNGHVQDKKQGRFSPGSQTKIAFYPVANQDRNDNVQDKSKAVDPQALSNDNHFLPCG